MQIRYGSKEEENEKNEKKKTKSLEDFFSLLRTTLNRLHKEISLILYIKEMYYGSFICRLKNDGSNAFFFLLYIYINFHIVGSKAAVVVAQRSYSQYAYKFFYVLSICSTLNVRRIPYTPTYVCRKENISSRLFLFFFLLFN